MKRLIQIMRECQGDMTQEEFAALLGVAQSTISMIYSGQRGIGRDLVVRMGSRFPQRRNDLAEALFLPSDNHDPEASFPSAMTSHTGKAGDAKG